MTIDDVLNYFGSYYRVSKDVGFSMNSPRNWRRIGYIPAEAQARIEEHTGGKLKFSLEHIKRRKNAAKS